MWSLKRSSIAFFLYCSLLLAIEIGGSANVFASSGPNTTVMATISGGSLTESLATNHVKLDVDKKARLMTYSLPITVTDARGSGIGWNLMITSTGFRSRDEDKDKDLLPVDASIINGVSASCNLYSTCTKPIDSVSYPVGVPAGYPLPAPVKFFNAAISSGLGKFLLTMIVNVSIPGHTEPGIYTSTIILTIANGP